MEINLTIYHFKNMIENLINRKRSTNDVFKDLSKALGVSFESFDKFKESIKNNTSLEKEFVWSVNFNDVVENLSKMKFKSRCDFLEGLSDDFLVKIFNANEAVEGFTFLADFHERVLDAAVKDKFKTESWNEMWISSLKRKMDINNEYTEMSFLTSLMNMGSENNLNWLFDNPDFLMNLEEKYLDKISLTEDVNIKFFEALNNRADYLKSRYSDTKVEVLTQKNSPYASEFTKDGYVFNCRKLSCISDLRFCNSDWKGFDFVSYVDEVVYHKRIKLLSFKFNRNLNDDEKVFFDSVVKNLLPQWDLSREEISSVIATAVLKAKLVNTVNSVKENNTLSDTGFKL